MVRVNITAPDGELLEQFEVWPTTAMMNAVDAPRSLIGFAERVRERIELHFEWADDE